ncbi:MAG: DUF5615 family PIN-like protein [Rhizobiales bacterium]|nr:DUF5615 family PIN-like protein [Hyphomicrobiales bacterium]
MRILCNENVPLALVEALIARGHDVVWIRLANPGISDRTVLDRAIREKRLCITFDKDFGELAARWALPAACGIILLRIDPPAAMADALTIVSILESRDDWAGHFSVLEPGRIRMRPLRA